MLDRGCRPDSDETQNRKRPRKFSTFRFATILQSPADLIGTIVPALGAEAPGQLRAAPAWTRRLCRSSPTVRSEV